MTDLSSKQNTYTTFMEKLYLKPAGVGVILVLLLLPFIPPFNQEYLLRWLVYAVFIGANAVAFDFTCGYINIVNFGFAAFVGLGAYTSAILNTNLGLSPWVGVFFGAFFAGFMGFLTGLISLRLRGYFAACLTWFLGLALLGLVNKMVWLTRGPLGLRTARFFEGDSNLPYYYVVLVMLGCTYFICKWITKTHIGHAFLAIGQNMEAARTSGINPVFYRIFNFTLSCFFAGWLGGFYAHYYGILTPELMNTQQTIQILIVAFIGGRCSLWGGAVVCVPFVIMMELLRSVLSELPGINLIIYGCLLILVMIYYPRGFAGFYEYFGNRWKTFGAERLKIGKPDRTTG